MHVFRQFGAPVLTVFLLLGLTTFDLGSDVLAYPSCETDLATSPWSPTPPSGQGGSDQSSKIHHDDCFCCSHCVQPAVLFSLASLATIQPFPFTQRWTDPSCPAYEFFRPPRLT